MNNKLGRAIEIAASAHINQKDVPYTDDVEVDENSILNSYPLKNIK